MLEVPEFVVTVPDPERIERINTLEGHLNVLRLALSNAKRVVRICSPFLTSKAISFPDLPVPQLVRQAVNRGVDVVIFNNPSNARNSALHGRAWRLLEEAGVKMVKVSNVQAKTLCVDNTENSWLSAAREGEDFRNLECSFRYLGCRASQLVERATVQNSLFPIRSPDSPHGGVSERYDHVSRLGTLPLKRRCTNLGQNHRDNFSPLCEKAELIQTPTDP